MSSNQRWPWSGFDRAPVATLAILLNLIQLVAVLAAIAGFLKPRHIPDALSVFIVLVLPLVNLLALSGMNDESWIGLFLQRKRLEEKTKIQKLQQSEKDE